MPTDQTHSPKPAHAFAYLIIWLLLALLVAGVQSGCDPYPDFKPEGDVRFDRDTVLFDTLFLNTPSPTQRLLIYNNTNQNLRIDEIRIAGGDGSPFEMMVDGREGKRLQGFELMKGDSLWAFFKLNAKVEGQHRDVMDRVIVKVGDQEQERLLFARVLNAYLFRDTVFEAGFYSLPADTMIVIDGVMVVAEDAELYIAPNTRLYFTSRRDTTTFQPASGIFVAGTLSARGNQGQPILFTNNRLNEPWQSSPNQWFGIIFGRTSQNNRMDWCIVQNANTGIRVDSIALDIFQPKLSISNAIIRNCSNFCLLGQGFAPGDDLNTSTYAIDGWNLLCYNAGQAPLALVGGGKYRIVQSTFAEMGWDFSGNRPTFVLTNTLRNSDGSLRERYGYDVQLFNNIFWGVNDDEVGFDLVTGAPAERLGLGNCLTRVKEWREFLSDPGGNPLNGLVFNQDPAFNAPFARPRDFRLKPTSAARARGADLSAIGLPLSLDLLAQPRNLPYDIGAYAYFDIPEED